MVREETLQIVDIIPETQYIVEKIKKILEPYNQEVKFAFLFGSYAAGGADRCSDVDIGIYFAENLPDNKKNEIRFKVMESLEPLEVQIGYLDDEDMPPVIFIAATNGIPLVINDEDVYNDKLMRNIHTLEEMRLIGLTG